MALRRFHFLNLMIHSQTHTLKDWPGHRLVKIGLATRPSIALWQFPPSFLFFLGVWVKLVALFIQAITTLSHKLSFSAQLTKCNVGPCWHALAHVGIQPSPPFIHWDTRFSCSIKFLDCRLYNNSFASALGRAFVIGTNTMALIQTC